MPGPLLQERRGTRTGPTQAEAPSSDALSDPLSTSLLRDATPRGALGPGQPRSWKTPLPAPGGRPTEVAAAKARSTQAPSLAGLDLAWSRASRLHAAESGQVPEPFRREPAAPIPTSAGFARVASHLPENDGFGYSGEAWHLVDPEQAAMLTPGATLAPGPERSPRMGVDPLAQNHARKQKKITEMMVPPSPQHPAFIKDRDTSKQPDLTMDTPSVHLSDDARKTFGAVPANVALTSFLDKTTGQVQMAPLIPDSSGKSAALDHEDILHPDLVVNGAGGRTLNKPIRHTPPAARAAAAGPGAQGTGGQSSHEQVAARFMGNKGVQDRHEDLLGFTTHKGGDGQIGALRWTSRTFNDHKFERYETADEEARRKELEGKTIRADSQDDAGINARNAVQLQQAKLSMNSVFGALKSGAGKKKGKSPKPKRVGGLGTDGKMSEAWRDHISAGLIGELGKSDVFVSDEVQDPRARHADDRRSAPSTAPLTGAAPLPQAAPLPAPLPSLRPPT